MPNCPVCDSEYTKEQDICSYCYLPLDFNFQQVSKLIDWGIKIWTEKCELEEKCQQLEAENQQLRGFSPQIFTQQNSSSFSETQLNDLQKQPKNLTERVYELEQSEQKFNQLNPQIVSLQSQLKALTLAREKEKEFFLEIDKEIRNLKEERSQLQSQLSQLLQQVEAGSQTKEQVSKIEARLNELEGFLKAKQRVYRDDSPQLDQSVNQEGNIPKTTAKQELDWEEYRLVQEYNENLDSLSQRASEVSETEKSISDRRMSSSSSITFEKKRRGNYLIVKEGDYEYLVPSSNLRINEHNYKTVDALFECRGFQPGYSEKFNLFKPAKVSSGSEAETWKLDEPGIIQF